MLTTVNYLNAKWNQFVFWFHHASARTEIRWLTNLSIWLFDRLRWELPDEWQLINGMPLKEYTLRYELELARHQTRYFVDYAYALQCQLLFPEKETIDTQTQQHAQKRSPRKQKHQRTPVDGAVSK